MQRFLNTNVCKQLQLFQDSLFLFHNFFDIQHFCFPLTKIHNVKHLIICIQNTLMSVQCCNSTVTYYFSSQSLISDFALERLLFTNISMLELIG